MVRFGVRKQRRNAADVKRKVTKMPEQSETEQIQAIRDLLREGRVNEADRQLDEMAEKIRQEIERKKREAPPPKPRGEKKLLSALLAEIVHFLGDKPRQLAIVTEYQAEIEKPEPN